MTKAELLSIIKDCSDDTEIKLSNHDGVYDCHIVSVTNEKSKYGTDKYIVLE